MCGSGEGDGDRRKNLVLGRGAQRCVTICPPFMYSNTANWPPLSDGPFIVASTRSLVERVKINRHPGSKREDCTVRWCNKGEYKAQLSPKSEPCGFKWAKTHNKCVHDSM